MAQIYNRRSRAVVQNHPELNQAVVPFVPPNQDVNDNQLAAVENDLQHAYQPRNSTRILAVVQRPRDRIYLTEDHKGKQMVVQRAQNVAKIQRKQRDEHFKPSDLRLRGPERPVAVGVVGRLGTSTPDDALWQARQLMQNAQSERSDAHRPLQEQEEQRLAEEARMRALAKNDRNMKSYRVDMGNMLETSDSSERTNDNAIGYIHNAPSNMQVCNQDNHELNHDQMENIDGYDVHDEYLDDEVYDNTEIHDDNTIPGGDLNENVHLFNESNSAEDDYAGEENNDFLGDEQCLVVDVNREVTSCRNPNVNSGYSKKELSLERNRQRMLESRGRQQLNMRQVIDDTAESRRLEAERKAEEARQKALKENEKKMKSYKVTMGHALGTAGVQHARSPCNSRSPMSSATSIAVASSSTSIAVASTSNTKAGTTSKALSKQEMEKRRQEENRQKMLAARERQQQEQLRIMRQTAETRRLEAERKAEEARQKALKQNEKKMKSYKVTMGYTLEDYVQDSASSTHNIKREQDNTAACVDNSMEQDSSTMHPSVIPSNKLESLALDNGGVARDRREQCATLVYGEAANPTTEIGPREMKEEINRETYNGLVMNGDVTTEIGPREMKEEINRETYNGLVMNGDVTTEIEPREMKEEINRETYNGLVMNGDVTTEIGPREMKEEINRETYNGLVMNGDVTTEIGPREMKEEINRETYNGLVMNGDVTTENAVDSEDMVEHSREIVIEEIKDQSQSEDDEEEVTQEQRNEQMRLAILKKQERLDKLLAMVKKNAKSP